MKYQNKNSKDLFFDKYFLNFSFSKTIADKDFKFCLLILHTRPEETMSQIFDSCLGFYFMSKNGKHFVQLLSIIF